MIFHVEQVTRVIEMRRYGSLHVRTGDEQVQFLHRGLEPIPSKGDRVVLEARKRLLKTGLIITFAIEERVARPLSGALEADWQCRGVLSTSRRSN